MSLVDTVDAAPWFDTDLYRSSLSTRWLGRTHETHLTCGSTNAVCLDRIRAGASPGLVVIARQQTAGRGRLGRPWVAPAGGLWWTAIIPLGRVLEDLPVAPRVTALAAAGTADAVGPDAGRAVRIRWPNDLLVDGKKLGGILAEVGQPPTGLPAVALGVGVNADLRSDDFAEPLRTGIATLRDAGATELRLPVLLARILNRIETYLGDPQAGLARYRELLLGRGERCRILPDRAGEVAVEGELQDVDPLGRLLVRTGDGLVRSIAAGTFETLP